MQEYDKQKYHFLFIETPVSRGDSGIFPGGINFFFLGLGVHFSDFSFSLYNFQRRNK